MDVFLSFHPFNLMTVFFAHLSAYRMHATSSKRTKENVKRIFPFLRLCSLLPREGAQWELEALCPVADSSLFSMLTIRQWRTRSIEKNPQVVTSCYINPCSDTHTHTHSLLQFASTPPDRSFDQRKKFTTYQTPQETNMRTQVQHSVRGKSKALQKRLDKLQILFNRLISRRSNSSYTTLSSRPSSRRGGGEGEDDTIPLIPSRP